LAFTIFDRENTSDDGQSWYTETYNGDGYFAGASTAISDYNAIYFTGSYPSDYTSDAVSASTSSRIPKTSSTVSSSSTVVRAPILSSTGESTHAAEDQKSFTPVGAIFGGTIGGIGQVALIAAAAFILKQKHQRSDSGSSTSNTPLTHAPTIKHNTPIQQQGFTNQMPNNKYSVRPLLINTN
jgi:hypothetical protein